MVDLDELETLHSDATPGEWEWYGEGDNSDVFVRKTPEDQPIAWDIRESDAAYITGVRDALPALIAELRAARAVIQAVRFLRDEGEAIGNQTCEALADYDAGRTER